MPDNTLLNAMSGGDTVRSLDRAGVKTSILGLDLNVGGGSEVLDTASALGDGTSNPTTALRGSLISFYNGTTWDRARGDTTSGLWVNVKNATLAATQSGTWNVGTVSTITNVVHVDDNGSTLSVDDGGGSLTVDGTVTATIAAGTSTIAKAEDAASANGDVGVGTLAVRKDTPANTSGTDGDYEFLQMANGRLWVSAAIDSALPAGSNVIGAVTQSGTWNVGTVSTVSTITNVVHVDDNGGSLTVDGTVSVSGTVTVDSEITTADLDTGAGTDTKAVIGLLYGASGGSVVVSTTNPLPIGDNGGSITVDGTVAATQSGTWNVGTVTTVSTVTSVTTVGTITNVVHIDDNSGSITVDGTVTASIAAGATTIAKAEDVASADADVGVPSMAVRKASPANTSGTDGDYEFLQMSAGRLWVSATIDAAIPTGSNVIGAVTQSGTWNVGTVTTITNVVHVDDNGSTISIDDGAGSITVDGTVTATIAAAATTIAKAEDAASADADVGVPSMAVRKGTPANTSGTDGDYEFLQMSAGRLWCSATIDAALPAGTNAIGKLAANTGVTIGAVEIAAAQTLATVTTVGTVSTITNVVHIDDNSGSITVDGTVAATQSGAWTVTSTDGIATASGTITTQNLVPAGTATASSAVEITVNGASTLMIQVTGTYTGALSLQVTVDGSTWVTVAGVPIVNVSTGGYLASITSALQSVFTADISGAVKARITALAAVTGTATVTLRADQSCSMVAIDAALPTGANVIGSVDTVTTLTGGGVASDGVDSGNPHKIGGRAIASLKTATMVSAADRSDMLTDLDGQQLTKSLCPFGDIINERVTDTGGTSTAFSNFSAVAGLRNYVTTISVFNSSATAGFLDIRDSAAGAVLFTIPLPAGGGAVVTFPVPLRQPTANAALAYDVSGALTTVYISLVGFQSKL